LKSILWLSKRGHTGNSCVSITSRAAVDRMELKQIETAVKIAHSLKIELIINLNKINERKSFLM